MTDADMWEFVAYTCPITPAPYENRTMGTECELREVTPRRLDVAAAYAAMGALPADLFQRCPRDGVWPPADPAAEFDAAYGTLSACDMTQLIASAPTRPAAWAPNGMLLAPRCVQSTNGSAYATPGTPTNCSYMHLSAAFNGSAVADRWRRCPAACNPAVFYDTATDTFGWAAAAAAAAARAAAAAGHNASSAGAALGAAYNISDVNGTRAVNATVAALVDAAAADALAARAPKFASHLTPATWLGCFVSPESPAPWLEHWRLCGTAPFRAASTLTDAALLIAGVLRASNASASNATAVAVTTAAVWRKMAGWGVSPASVLGCPVALTALLDTPLLPAAFEAAGHPCNASAWVAVNPRHFTAAGIHNVSRHSVWRTREVSVTPTRLGRICGGRRRAGVCAAADFGCAQRYTAHVLDRANTAAPVYKCHDDTGCECAAGSGLDPLSNCARCIRGHVFTDTSFTRCREISECLSGPSDGRSVCRCAPARARARARARLTCAHARAAAATARASRWRRRSWGTSGSRRSSTRSSTASHSGSRRTTTCCSRARATRGAPPPAACAS